MCRRLGAHAPSLFSKEQGESTLKLNVGYADMIVSSATPYFLKDNRCLAVIWRMQVVPAIQTVLVQAGKLTLHHEYYFGYMERRMDERQTTAYFQVGMWFHEYQPAYMLADIVVMLLVAESTDCCSWFQLRQILKGRAQPISSHCCAFFQQLAWILWKASFIKPPPLSIWQIWVHSLPTLTQNVAP